MTKKYIYSGKIGDVPLNISWSVLSIFAYVLIFSHSLNSYLLVVVSYFLLVLFHELGHASICKMLGYDVIMIEIIAIGGYCHHEQPQYEHEQILISWGGILAQLLILAVSIAAYCQFKKFNISETNIFYIAILSVGIVLNSFLIIINLFPSKMADGYYALRIFKMIPVIIKSKCGTKKSIKIKNSKNGTKVIKLILRNEANDIIEKIMNKISESGLESLSKEEKNELNMARKTLKYR